MLFRHVTSLFSETKQNQGLFCLYYRCNLCFTTGSQEERDTVKFAINSDSTRKEYEVYPADEEDVDFTLEVLDSVAMGDRFEVKVVVQNKSNNKRTVKVNITSVMAFYTGISAKPLKATKETLSFKAKEGTITETL